jgi:hypothetical protein
MTQADPRAHARFLLRLAVYFLLLGVLLVGIFDSLPLLFDGDTPRAEASEISRTFIEGLLDSSGRPPSLERESMSSRLAILAVLAIFFTSTVLHMVPITWVYMYTHPRAYGRSLITALLILPICATATVWLIQDSLALAFGLAALVAAVRFRIRLSNPLDGVYIFSAISVGLASGVGHIGVGYLMTLFFCSCATVVWILRYGKHPADATAEDHGSAASGGKGDL